MKVNVPPIKSQGIKTKLVPWIASIIPSHFDGTWIEPFLGTGVVAFNVAPKRAMLCDSNPHLINFYNAIAQGEITASRVRGFLTLEGKNLIEKGEKHYYEIRDRFNKTFDPLDFLFLNRAGFNGMIRFNRKGEFNIPFCRKPHRFAQAYITKIANQVSTVANLLKLNHFVFKCQSFEDTIECGTNSDLIYCDPPYIDRHVDYYNGWNKIQEQKLYELLSRSESKFILSTWHHNDFRKNEFIESLWNQFTVLTREHFYHVGGSEKNRNPVVEALVINYPVKPVEYQFKKQEQLTLLDRQVDSS